MHASDHSNLLQRRRLTAICVHWLLFGTALVLLLPAARGSSLWIGWLPYWLCVAPSMCLLVLQPRSIQSALQRSLRAGRAQQVNRRRGKQARRQAPRLPLRSISLASLLGR